MASKIKSLTFLSSLLLLPVPANAGIPGVRTITLLYWSDPVFILIAASTGFAIARLLRWLPADPPAMTLYFVLVPITVASIPIAWMIDPVVLMITEKIATAAAEPLTSHAFISWLARPSYWYLDDPASLRAVYRLGLLVFSLAISFGYQMLLLKVIAPEFGIKNRFKVSAAISGTAFLLLLLLTQYMHYSDLSWPR